MAIAGIIKRERVAAALVVAVLAFSAILHAEDTEDYDRRSAAVKKTQECWSSLVPTPIASDVPRPSRGAMMTTFHSRSSAVPCFCPTKIHAPGLGISLRR